MSSQIISLQARRYGPVTLAANGTAAVSSDRMWPAPRTFALQTVVTGSPASFTHKLQGSIDGTNYVDLATTTNTAGEITWVVDKPVEKLQVVLSALTGGTAPTVTSFVLALS